jgi:hypothetical protein
LSLEAIKNELLNFIEESYEDFKKSIDPKEAFEFGNGFSPQNVAHLSVERLFPATRQCVIFFSRMHRHSFDPRILRSVSKYGSSQIVGLKHGGKVRGISDPSVVDRARWFPSSPNFSASEMARVDHR